MGVTRKDLTVEDFYFLKIRNMWRYFKKEHFSFWMICAYLFFEYTRPQAIFPAIDILPWAQTFLLGSMIGAFLDPTVRWVASPVNKLLNLFALIIFVSSLLAYRPEVSREHFIDFYSWFVIYYLIILIVNTRERFYIMVVIFLISAGKIAVGTSLNWAKRGFSFTSWGLTGPPGYFQNSGELAILMLTLFPVAYFLFDNLKDRISRTEYYLLIVFFVAPMLTVVGASSRGAQLALAVQLLVIFYKSVFRFRRLVVISALLFSLYHLLPPEQMARFQSAGEDKTSIQRLLYWEHGLEMMREFPAFGVGFFNFAPYYDDYYPQDALYGKAQLPHNIFIQVGTDSGYIGLTAFLLLLIWPYLMVFRRQKQIAAEDPVLAGTIRGFLYGLLGFTLAGQFVTVAYYPFLWLGLAFVVAGLNVAPKKKKKTSQSRVLSRQNTVGSVSGSG